MRSFLSLVERTSKGKASVNNKHVTCDLLCSIELGSNYHPQSEYGLMLVEHHAMPRMISLDDCFDNMSIEQNVKQPIRVNLTSNKMRLNPDRVYLIKSKFKK